MDALTRRTLAPAVDSRTAADVLFGRGALDAPRSTHCLWATDVGAAIGDSPAVSADGEVFVSGKDQNVFALDGLRGTKLWRFDPQASRGYTPEVGAGATHGAYVGTRKGDAGKVFALSAAADPATAADDDGVRQPKVAWSFETASPVMQPPEERAGRVFVPCRDRLYTLDAGSGQKLWEFDVPRGGLHSFEVDDAHVYVRSGSDLANDRDNHVYALDVASGDDVRLAHPPMPQPACRRPGRLSDGTTFRLRFDDNGVYAYDAQERKTWAYQTGGEVLSHPTVGPHDIAYVGSGDHKIYALAADAAALVSRLARDAARKKIDAARPPDEPREIVKQDDYVVINGVRVPRRTA